MTFTVTTYTLDQPALDWCKRLAMKRSGSMAHKDTANSRNMMTHRPPWHRHYVGVIGELAYSWFSSHPVDQKTIGRGDDGTDFLDGVQVKASDCTSVPDLMFLQTQWNRKLARVYVLVWVRGYKASLLGWISREDIERLATTRDYGHGPTLVVDSKHLRPMEEL